MTSTVSYGDMDEYHQMQVLYSQREDQTETIGVRLDYQMRRWLVLGGGLTSKASDSTLNVYDVDRNIFFLSAQISL